MMMDLESFYKVIDSTNTIDTSLFMYSLRVVWIIIVKCKNILKGGIRAYSKDWNSLICLLSFGFS